MIFVLCYEAEQRPLWSVEAVIAMLYEQILILKPISTHNNTVPIMYLHSSVGSIGYIRVFFLIQLLRESRETLTAEVSCRHERRLKGSFEDTGQCSYLITGT